MKRLLPLTLIVFVLIAGCNRKSSASIEPTYTYTPPANWDIKMVPKVSKNKVAFGQLDNGFKTNINVIAHHFIGSVEEFEKTSNQELVSALGAGVLKQEDFTTDKGMPGRKVVYTTTQGQYQLVHYAYLFEKDDFIFGATGTASTAAIVDYEPIFDQSMKTFMFQ